jgi:pro-kumamolisin-like protein/Big-like domain-containing protein
MRPSPRVFRKIISLALSPLLFCFGSADAQQNKAPARITQVIDAAKLTLLGGNTHPLARSEFDAGTAPPNLRMQRMLLVLSRSPQQEIALQNLLKQQQDRSSQNYHAWLTPAEFGQQFGPAAQDVQTIISWLKSNGFQVERVANGRGVIEFSGTAGQVQAAFHTAIHSYVVDGKQHWANATDPQIPSALVPVVNGILSLHNFQRKPLHHVIGTFSREKGSGTEQLHRIASPENPLFTAGANCGLNRTTCYAVGPNDFAAIYNVLPLWNATSPVDGTGQTIAIVGQSDIYTHDVTDFRDDFGLPAANLNIINDGPDPGKLATEGDETESDLDVEWAGAIAKGATIDFVVSASTNSTAGVDLSAEYIVDNDLAPILSESYGECELSLGTAGNQFFNQLWQQAAAEGITVLIAAGDSGSAVCDQGSSSSAVSGLSVNGIGSTPYNISVGGTDFNDLNDPTTYWNSSNNSVTQQSAKGYIPEMTWNDTCTNAEFFQFNGTANAEADCNDTTSVFWPAFLPPVGGSGGASNCTTPSGPTASDCAGGYAKPAWQMGAGVPNDGKRDVPDVSMFAGAGLNASFYVACESDIFGGCAGDVFNMVALGGTSAPTPALAGIMAMIDQKTQSRQGNINYVLYPLSATAGASCSSSGTAASSCIFYDVTTGTNAMPCETGTPNCLTNAGGDQNGVLSGYNTTSGYDLATGLGSLNAANLANNWTNVAFQPTITALMLNGGNAINVTHGSSINVNITVTPKIGTGTPSGLVSLATSAGPNAGTFNLLNGSVSASTETLAGGSYTVTAHYAGDGVFGASDSSPAIPVTVSPEQSVTTVQAFTLDQNDNAVPFTTAPYGGSVVFIKASVAGKSGQGVATGTVNFNETLNGTTSNLTGNPYSLNSNSYTMTPLPGGFYIPYTPGTYSIAAAYSGDASFNSSTSMPVGFTITKAQTATMATFNGCASSSGQCTTTPGSSIAVFATVVSNTSGDLPTGTMTLFDNGAQLGSPVAIDSNIIPPFANISTNQLSVGLHNITAQYSGDGNYLGSTSAASTIEVGNRTTLSLATSSPAVQNGQSVTFTAQVTGQASGPQPTGTVLFTANGVNIGSAVTLSSSGQAQITTNSLPLGSVQIVATYSGDQNNLSSSSGLTEMVAAVTDFVLSANPSSLTISNPGQSGSTTLTFTGQGGFTGSATLSPSMCSNLPPESSCNFSPTTVSLTSSTATVPVILTITTTAPSSAALFTPHLRLPFPTIVVGFLLLICIVSLRKQQHNRWRAVFALTVLAAILAPSGCGGGATTQARNAGTPTGSYSGVTVTVKINNTTQSITNLSVTVQ